MRGRRTTTKCWLTVILLSSLAALFLILHLDTSVQDTSQEGAEVAPRRPTWPGRLANLTDISLLLDPQRCEVERALNGPRDVGDSSTVSRGDPPYCWGPAILYTPETARQLLSVSVREDVPVLWVDDVFVTGVLAKKAGLGHMFIRMNHKGHRMMEWLHADHIQRPLDGFFGGLILSNNLMESMHQLWGKTLKYSKVNCIVQ